MKLIKVNTGDQPMNIFTKLPPYSHFLSNTGIDWVLSTNKRKIPVLS